MTSIVVIEGGHEYVHNDVTLSKTSWRNAARSISALMAVFYWEISRHIVEFKQNGQDRAVCSKEMIKLIGTDLSHQFGRGLGWRNLSLMRVVYLPWPSNQILSTLSARSSMHQSALPHEKMLAEELDEARRELKAQWIRPSEDAEGDV